MILLCIYTNCHCVLQVDYNRCYGALEVASADIKAKKCTWLIVEAVRRANTKQRSILEVSTVKTFKLAN